MARHRSRNSPSAAPADAEGGYELGEGVGDGAIEGTDKSPTTDDKRVLTGLASLVITLRRSPAHQASD